MLFAPGLPTLILKLLDLRLIGRCLYSGLFYARDLMQGFFFAYLAL